MQSKWFDPNALREYRPLEYTIEPEKLLEQDTEIMFKNEARAFIWYTLEKFFGPLKDPKNPATITPLRTFLESVGISDPKLISPFPKQDRICLIFFAIMVRDGYLHVEEISKVWHITVRTETFLEKGMLNNPELKKLYDNLCKIVCFPESPLENLNPPIFKDYQIANAQRTKTYPVIGKIDKPFELTTQPDKTVIEYNPPDFQNSSSPEIASTNTPQAISSSSGNSTTQQIGSLSQMQSTGSDSPFPPTLQDFSLTNQPISQAQSQVEQVSPNFDPYRSTSNPIPDFNSNPFTTSDFQSPQNLNNSTQSSVNPEFSNNQGIFPTPHTSTDPVPNRPLPEKFVPQFGTIANGQTSSRPTFSAPNFDPITDIDSQNQSISPTSWTFQESTPNSTTDITHLNPISPAVNTPSITPTIQPSLKKLDKTTDNATPIPPSDFTIPSAQSANPIPNSVIQNDLPGSGNISNTIFDEPDFSSAVRTDFSNNVTPFTRASTPNQSPQTGIPGSTTSNGNTTSPTPASV